MREMLNEKKAESPSGPLTERYKIALNKLEPNCQGYI
jgi:hypothetical protein